MRRKIIAGNWKMNCTPTQAAELIIGMKDKLDTGACDVVFCVPSVDLLLAAELLKDTKIGLGAQNMHFEDKGAFTGEISAAMVRETGAEYVIIGHSERREYFAETDETVNKKAIKAIAAGLTPIICVGESLLQREQGVTRDLVRMQTRVALGGVSAEDAANVVIAYEPIWAIGTGRVATPEQAQEACSAIREVVGEIYGKKTADAIRVQYGGSVNGANAAELFAMPDIDGALVGGASLKPEFADIVKCCN
ncbi:MAG: triose-phosphate isomerase [Defluviitaleaceae bacterium]|nr:triose-phosphate isomerase [Defluviitaleaceae bacterium]